jgi:hypothetical protein
MKTLAKLATPTGIEGAEEKARFGGNEPPTAGPLELATSGTERDGIGSSAFGTARTSQSETSRDPELERAVINALTAALADVAQTLAARLEAMWAATAGDNLRATERGKP